MSNPQVAKAREALIEALRSAHDALDAADGAKDGNVDLSAMANRASTEVHAVYASAQEHPVKTLLIGAVLGSVLGLFAALALAPHIPFVCK